MQSTWAPSRKWLLLVDHVSTHASSCSINRQSAVRSGTTRVKALPKVRLIGRQRPSTAAHAKSVDEGPSFASSPEDGCANLVPLPDALLRDLAQMPGVRVVMDTDAAEEEEEEDWDEVMSELTDPWMADPPTSADKLEDMGALGAAAVVPPPLPAADVEVVQDVQQLQAIIQQHGGNLVVVDVRTMEEFAAGPSVPGSVNCPIQSLTGDIAKDFATGPVLVLGTADYRGSQACIRLTKVYGALTVYYFEPGTAAWPVGLQLRPSA